jgi:ABC-type dipeptide/oligopeptide/nickel transport system permease component
MALGSTTAVASDGAWTAGPALPFRFVAAVAPLPGNRTLIIGTLPGPGIAEAVTYDATTGRLTPASPPNDIYLTPEAASLPDGRVFILGTPRGGSLKRLAAAEIYNPKRDSWSATSPPPLATANRYSLAALGDGRVLVSGGQDRGGLPISNSEVYDPATDAWTVVTGPTTVGGAVSVRLKDGRVLIVGGGTSFDAGSALASAYIFDPRSGAWASLPDMSAARIGPAAVVLADGRVLVAGGLNGGGGIRDAEVFDPTTGTWTSVGPMGVGRANAAAALLSDGRVLIAGGQDISHAFKSSELFDPVRGTFSSGAEMLTPGGGPGVLMSGGRVLAFGLAPSSRVEVFDPNGVPAPRPSALQQLVSLVSKGDFFTWLAVALMAIVLGIFGSVSVGLRQGWWWVPRGLAGAGFQVGGVVAAAVLLLLAAGKGSAAQGSGLAGQGGPPQFAFLTRPLAAEVITATSLSIELIALTVIWATLAGLGSAVAVASFRHRRLLGLDLLGVLFWTIPTFLIAILVQEFQALVYGHSGLVIAAGFGDVNAIQVSWAAVVLGVRPAAYLYRHGRSVLEREASEDYVRTAEAKGLKWSKVVRSHLLRAGGGSLITTWLNAFRLMIGALPLVEYFFGYPGIGRVLVLSLGVPQAGRMSLHPDLALALIIVLGLVIVFAEQVGSALRSWLDPRLRTLAVPG